MTEGILVTGLGAVSAAGLNVSENIAVLSAGKRALSDEPSLFRTALRLPVGEVRAKSEQLLQMLALPEDAVVTRTALLAALAAREAVRDAALDQETLAGGRTGLVLGTSVGGMDLSEEFYGQTRPDFTAGDIRKVMMHDCGSTTSFVADHLGLKGFTTTVSTACSSAGNAIMLGARLIRSGALDNVIVGGSDSLNRFTMNGFNSLRILSSLPGKPFDVSRDGLNLGEGAGFIVLSAASKAHGRPYCRLTGWANTDEAYHQTGSSEEGDGALAAMTEALAVAGLSAGDVDYVNTHGTATPGNDLSEGTAIKRLFQGKVRFGSFKGYIGHTLAASEGIEAVFCARSLSDGVIWSSVGFSVQDPEIGLSPVTQKCEGVQLRHILSNSFGFGGNNSSLVFSSL